MTLPEQICTDCFDHNRTAYPVGDACELVGVYCQHSSNAASTARSGSMWGEWTLYTVDEADFWKLMRLSAQYARHEISALQVSTQIMKSVMRKKARYG